MNCNEIYNLYCRRRPLSEIHAAFIEVDMNDRDEHNYGHTPLHLACRFADPKAVEILVERGADVNVRDAKGNTPLCILGMCSYLYYDEDSVCSAASILLSKGARVPRSGNDTTALIEAVRNRHFRMACAIVDSGARIDSFDKNGDNVLHVACNSAWLTATDIKGLSGHVARMKEEGWHSEMKMSEKLRELECLKAQEHDASVLVKKILDTGTLDPEEKSGTGKRPLDIAVERDLTVISALLRGLDPDNDELAALSGGMNIFQAIANRNHSAIDAVLRIGTELQTVCEDDVVYGFRGNSPLACSLIWQDTVSVEMILAAGADPNWRMPDGRTAFASWAYMNNALTISEDDCRKIFEAMADCGWNPELPADGRGNSSLAISCLRIGHGPCNAAFDFMLSMKTDTETVNDCGQTPLLLLCGGDYWDGRLPVLPVLPRSYPYGRRSFGSDELRAFEPLLEAGASVHCRDMWGNTLLHYLAAGCRGKELRMVTEILEDYGVPDVSAVNNEGLSAVDVAAASNNEDMIRFLVKF